MAAKVVTTVSKKIPIAGLDFSSVSASCTVEAEISDLSQVSEQARVLYAQAEAAVDEQLQLTASPAPTAPRPPPAPTPTAPGTSYRPSANAAQRAANPPPSNQRGGRGMPRASASQLKLIEHLCDGDHHRADDICAANHVRSLPELTIRQESQVIDRLKAEVPA